jgi:hypothetical protein
MPGFGVVLETRPKQAADVEAKAPAPVKAAPPKLGAVGTAPQIITSGTGLPEEVKFILAIHYLQAIQQQVIGKDDGQKKFKKLLTELRKEYPQSLKPLTLEALSPTP